MPRIRYCSTPAGRVAYSASGTGPALLVDTGWITDLRGQLELYSFGPFIARLAERFTVIRYDKPGCGLSDRTGIDLSFEGQVAALIPGATLIPLSGSSHLFYHGDWLAVAEAVIDFLAERAGDQPRLTHRELQVAELVAEGLTNQAIASRLSIAPRTAETHVENIRRKLQVNSRAQIATWVTRHRPPS